MLTKEQLTDAHEQGLSIITRNGNIKIVAILNDVYGVNHFNSNKVQWWMFENFERNEAKIEQPKPKYNGRAVKCDTVEQWQWLTQSLRKFINIQLFKSNCCVCIQDKKNEYIGTIRDEQHFKHEGYEIISFSDYCKEQGIKEPKWIQGFEIGKAYNDVVMVSDNLKSWHIKILQSVNNGLQPFNCGFHSWKYCRYLNKNEINEIKFSN